MCHTTHPELKLLNGVLVGASGMYEREGFDVYVDFTASGTHGRSLPWSKTVQIAFGIPDMGVPKDLKTFKQLVGYIVQALKDGKRVHIGCFGGHGRTGMVMAAIYVEATGDVDAIQWVRKNHCKKGVESIEQVDFLMKHFKCTHAAPTKTSHKAVEFPDEVTSLKKELSKKVMTLAEYQESRKKKTEPVAEPETASYMPVVTSNYRIWRR